ncbi:hypothetical protein [Curtobacterium sp. RRHDQ10]|uniref:hypothetical protein n=1 Tax=Curtobacterium phyllosphaerae TaxID=3413379 RepID=UPI003BF0D5C2
MTTGSTVRAITATAVALAGIVALAGCTSSGGGVTSTSSARASGSTAAHGTGSPSSSATPEPVGTRVDVPCDTLVPASVFAVYGQAFTLADSAQPAKASPAADIAAQRGQVCIWRNASGDVTVTLAVASLPAAPLTRLKDSLYEDSHSVPTYTVEGYFDTAGSVGRADAFVDPYWIDVESTMFTEPGAVQPIMDSARAALAGTASPSASPTP